MTLVGRAALLLAFAAAALLQQLAIDAMLLGVAELTLQAVGQLRRLYLKTLSFLWNVEGQMFITLHLMFMGLAKPPVEGEHFTHGGLVVAEHLLGDGDSGLQHLATPSGWGL